MEELQNIIEKAEQLLEQEDYTEVINLLTEEILKTYQKSELYFIRGKAYYYLSEFDASLQDIITATQLSPESSEYYYWQGAAWYKKDDYDKAIECYNEAIRLDPNHVSTFNNLGLAWYEKKNYDKAIEYYNEAIRLDPNYVSAFNDLGNIWCEKDDYDKGIEYYNKAIRLDPNYAIAYVSLGNAWGNKKSFDKALKNFFRTIELNENISGAYYGIGVIYTELNFYQHAAAYFKRAYCLRYSKGNLIRIFSETYVAPFLLQEILMKLFGITENLQSYDSNIFSNEAMCRPRKFLLHYGKLLQPHLLNPVTLLRLEAMVTYYMGHVEKAFDRYSDDIAESALTLQDSYYFALSADEFLEPNSDILDLALAKATEKEQLSDEELYYTGQLYILKGDFTSAENTLLQADRFVPARYLLIKIYKTQKRFAEMAVLADKIEKLEGETGFILSKGFEPILLTLQMSLNQFEKQFRKLLYHFELIDETNEIRAYKKSDEVVKHPEFYEAIRFSDGLQQNIEAKVNTREIRRLESGLIQAFSTTAHKLSIQELENVIKSNLDMQKVVEEVESLANRWGNTVEHQLALIIRKLEHSAKWYIDIIKYFYLKEQVGGRAALLLHFYLLNVATHKNDQSVVLDVQSEIKIWIPSIALFLQSHIVFRLLVVIWERIQNGKPEEKINQSEEYKDFKRKFRTEFLPWWQQSKAKAEFEYKNLMPKEYES